MRHATESLVTAPGAVEIGAIVEGRYRLDRVLGQGGMSIVVQAMHLQLHQPVAIKFLRAEYLGKHQIVQRFLREAQAAVRLRSEHVARVIDVGTLETGVPYMVLEYLDGADLSSFRSRLAVGQVVDLTLQACEALAEAHAMGIVHRDIKPANLFITHHADGTLLLKVLDFGISKIRTASGRLTAPQAPMGTPAYMSPEQMRSPHDIDHRSDIWSLGVVLYELLQGAPPFGDEVFSSMVLRVASEPPRKLTVPLPGDLADIVYRCLEKDPEKRFQSTAEFAQQIAKYARSETQAALSVQRTRSIAGMATPPTASEPGTAPHTRPSTISALLGARTTSPRGGRPWPIAVAMGVLIGVVAIAFTGVPWTASGPARSATPPAIPQPITRPQVAPPPPRARAAPTPAAPPLPAVTTPPEPPAVIAPPSVRAAKPVAGKPKKPSVHAAKPATPPARRPSLPDDDILGTRK
jgi:serine/threonine-protein kinase